ncbi:hypothetical protein Hamer_G017125 [Homarus americanus]|uniref:Uncharacterized protein n=1 Tax=Homarus americanus TaxID=6706 RepID=A0A8J5K2T9_HOMAM|nr:hypothetical protein Hamer_G017125 [Homarus americanus]
MWRLTNDAAGGCLASASLLRRLLASTKSRLSAVTSVVYGTASDLRQRQTVLESTHSTSTTQVRQQVVPARSTGLVSKLTGQYQTSVVSVQPTWSMTSRNQTLCQIHLVGRLVMFTSTRVVPPVLHVTRTQVQTQVVPVRWLTGAVRADRHNLGPGAATLRRRVVPEP